MLTKIFCTEQIPSHTRMINLVTTLTHLKKLKHHKTLVSCDDFRFSICLSVVSAKVMSQMMERKRMIVETDATKLVSHLCGANIYNTGEDPKLKPDSEYPDWLWKLRTERGCPPLEELDPQQPQYWRVIKRQQKRKEALLRKTRNKFGIF